MRRNRDGARYLARAPVGAAPQSIAAIEQHRGVAVTTASSPGMRTNAKAGANIASRVALLRTLMGTHATECESEVRFALILIDSHFAADAGRDRIDDHVEGSVERRTGPRACTPSSWGREMNCLGGRRFRGHGAPSPIPTPLPQRRVRGVGIGDGDSG